MNVTAVLRKDAANSVWRVAERYGYDPYGRATVLNGDYDADGAVSDWSADADGKSDGGDYVLPCG